MGFIFSTPAILAASGLMRPPFFKYSTVSSKISVLSRDTLLRQAAAMAKQGREVVLTGRDPAPWMQEAADYSTELRAVRHPYTQGIPAREGIEY